VDVEVGVNLQEAARLDLMQTAAAKVRIGDQPVDAGQVLEPEQHLEAVHGVEKRAHVRRDHAVLVVVAELLLQRRLEAPPAHLLRRRELGQHALEIGVVEQAVEDDVRKGIGLRVAVAERACVEVQLHRRHVVLDCRVKSRAIVGEYVTHPTGER
jgi:hypothetical protein